jgi:hypothetical protein
VSKLHSKINVIEEYPFRIHWLIVDVLGKPTNWKSVLASVGEDFDVLADHIQKLRDGGERQIVCPVPEHKTEITSSKELHVLRARKGQAALYRGHKADGALIKQGEVYALASADCPTVSLHDPRSALSTVVAVHFSRQSGVVGDILERALTYFSQTIRNRLIATVSLGIDVQHFDHRWDDPLRGATNETLTKRLIKEFGEDSVSRDQTLGGIDLKFIAVQKLLRAGVLPSNIFVDKIDTYTDPRFWSHRASNKPGKKAGDIGRNLVLVHA